MRVFRLIATPVILLALLGLLLWGANWGWKALTEPLPTPSPTPCVMQSATVVTPAQVTIRVYNGGFTTGLANRTATKLKDAGFKIAKTTNTEEMLEPTVIRGNEREKAMLELARGQFIEATIEYDQRVDGTVDVILGRSANDKNFAEAPPTEIVTDAGMVCVAASKTPTPSGSGTPVPSPSASTNE